MLQAAFTGSKSGRERPGRAICQLPLDLLQVKSFLHEREGEFIHESAESRTGNVALNYAEEPRL